MTRKSAACLAVGLAAAYLALSLLALACLPDVVPVHSGHEAGHGHHHSAAHSPLCSWACQSTTENAFAAGPPDVGLQWLLLGMVLFSSAFRSPRSGHFTRSRAPPR
jgi:hypothetical protein